jgi:hypothetical protein
MRFGVRDLFWLTLLVAVSLNWYQHNQEQIEVVYQLERSIDRLSNEVWVRKERHDWFWREGRFRNMSEADWQSYELPKLEEKK